LAGIVGSLELLRNTDISPGQWQFTETAITCCNELMRVVNEILDLSKIQAGTVQLTMQATDLDALIADVEKIVAPFVVKKGLHYEVHKDPTISRFIITDPQKLRQILVNLFSNAAKFTERGHIKLSVTLTEPYSHSQPSPPPTTTTTTTTESSRKELSHCVKKNFLKFAVTDTGSGISPETIPTLFRPYRQAKREDTACGTGLGLVICKKFVEQMGGSIHLHSDGIGKGCTAYFVIPYNPCHQESAGLPHPVRKTLKQFEPPLHVLLVEDNIINQMVIGSMLKTLGCHVKTAAHGAEAVQLAKQHKFCLIFMDLQMPAMGTSVKQVTVLTSKLFSTISCLLKLAVDGFTATREIRKVSGDTPVIALSADTCVAEQQRCEQEGMKGFVIKPTHTEVLQHVIEQTHDPRKCSYCASKT